MYQLMGYFVKFHRFSKLPPLVPHSKSLCQSINYFRCRCCCTVSRYISDTLLHFCPPCASRIVCHSLVQRLWLAVEATVLFPHEPPLTPENCVSCVTAAYKCWGRLLHRAHETLRCQRAQRAALCSFYFPSFEAVPTFVLMSSGKQ